MYVFGLVLANASLLAREAGTITRARLSGAYLETLQLPRVNFMGEMGKTVPLDRESITPMVSVGEKQKMMTKSLVTLGAIMVVNVILLVYFLYLRRKERRKNDRRAKSSLERLYEDAEY